MTVTVTLFQKPLLERVIREAGYGYTFSFDWLRLHFFVLGGWKRVFNLGKVKV